MSNPHTITWVNSTLNEDGTPYDAPNQNAGYEIQLDNAGAAVGIPLAYGTTFDLATLAAYQALRAGSHTVQLRCVNKGGESSAWTNPVTFLLVAKPKPPTALAVA